MDGDNGRVPTRAVLFSLGALSSSSDVEELAAITFRAMVDRFDIRGDAARSYGLFCSRFAQVARWYDEQRSYRQADMLRSARLAALLALGVKPREDELTALEAKCNEATARRMAPREGAFELLETLHSEGIRTALVTNADCDQFRDMLAATGLAPLLDVTICCVVAHSCKPDPCIFYQALRLLGCRPSEALLVGTSPQRDLRGAQLVGMRGVLLRAKSPRWWDQGDCHAEHEILRLHEVTSLVRRPAPAGGPRVRRRDSTRVPTAVS
jgi:HAD superfamily hydrolase (TIGR01509 family)